MAARAETARKAADCRLPTTARMRYWQPAPALAGLVSGYHLYAIATEPGSRHRDVFQPAWANIRILLTAGADWRVKVGEGAWHRVEQCALFGPSSSVTWSDSASGIVVGAGLTPLGWARLIGAPAATAANRVTDCGVLLGGGIAALRPMLCAAQADDALPVLLDAFLIGAMGHPGRLDPIIARIDRALLDPAIGNVAALAATVGLTPRSLERVAARAFGFPPKLLLRRARFLRSLHAIRAADAAKRAAAIDPGYTDYPHFVRDAHEFLGMSPQAFLKLDNPLFVQSARLRSEILGAPAQALGTAA